MVATVRERTDRRVKHALLAAARSNEISDTVPPIKKTKRRKSSDASLLAFLETYFPEVFCMDWSPDALRIIDHIQSIVERGGLKAIAMPRGSGKTSIILRAALWAILSGRKRFCCIVAANEDMAVSNLNSLKVEINHNPELFADYGRELHCLAQLGNEPRRSTSQSWKGQHTGVEYSTRKICFGSIPGSHAKGACISTAGITGQVRGQQHPTLEGEILRPDLVLIDDGQTKSSAGSAAQVKKRHETMMGDVLGLAGPGVEISGFATGTVIYQNDLYDRILNRKLSSVWNGDKISMIKSWPKWIDGWDQYNSIRQQEYFEQLNDHEESTAFVANNFERLHEGAEVYWESRKAPGDLSALHHAMNLYYRDQGVFAAEYQNAPMSAQDRPPFDLNIDDLSRRIIGIPRGRVPEDSDRMTAFIDVQREMLYFVVCAWTKEGRCYIVDYGACPDQQKHYWSKLDVSNTLQHAFGEDIEAYLRGGLDWLTKAILENDYQTEDGNIQRVDRLAIDARWGESTHVIRRFVRESVHRSKIHPSMGIYIGANTKNWQKMKPEKRDKKGVHARLTSPKNEIGQRELQYDTNFWKSCVADRLVCGTQSPKAILLFDAQPHVHRMFAEHCCYETPVRVIGKADNEVVEWRQDKHGSSIENDYWDCLVGNFALASTLGVNTHVGNTGKSRMSAAIEKIRSSKPNNQFFRKR